MAEPRDEHGGAPGRARVRVQEAGPVGMLVLRATSGTQGLAEAVESVAGTGLPGCRGIRHAGPRSVAWMSPDEYLLVMPPSEVPAACAALSAALAGQHHLVADVSDARVMFRLEGEGADDAIARLCPVDLARLPPGELRRTRAAQVACALWRTETGFALVVFRSVGRYMRDLLAGAAY